MSRMDPNELYQGLVANCTDPDFIEQTMRQMFPDWVKPKNLVLGRAKFIKQAEARREARKRLIEEAAVEEEHKRQQKHYMDEEKAMAKFSHELLKALHRHHQPILFHLRDKHQRQVVMP